MGRLWGTLQDSTLFCIASVLTGSLVIAASVLALVLSFHSVGILRVVQLLWNACFGVVIALPYIEAFASHAERLVGFVHTWLGRGTFLLYVGCFVLPHENAASASRILSIVAACACFLSGAVELFAGCCGYQESRVLSGETAAPLIKEGDNWQVSQASKKAPP
ncbi:hypothetical protein AB1Y20_005168 [Prymnesium parvum]|uniref:Uncharacterized protein n=1 Tax=Prymnesium parvum TaxID=97485 RepID=A0AB34J4M8_PRYPA